MPFIPGDWKANFRSNGRQRSGIIKRYRSPPFTKTLEAYTPTALPSWHTLIAAWIAKGQYGLTIPFLVGARALTLGAATANKADIEALLHELIEHPVPNFIVYARWCDDIDSVVLASYAMDFPYRPRHNLIEFRSSLNGTLSLAAEKSLATRLGAKASPTELLNALVSHALPRVEKGHFSRYWTLEGRENGPFQESDLAFIRASLATNAS